MPETLLTGRSSDHVMLHVRVPLAPVRAPPPANQPKVNLAALEAPGIRKKILRHEAWATTAEQVLGWEVALPSARDRLKLRKKKLKWPRGKAKKTSSGHRGRALRKRQETIVIMDADAKAVRDTLTHVLTDLGIMAVPRARKRNAIICKATKGLTKRRMQVDASIREEQARRPGKVDHAKISELKR